MVRAIDGSGKSQWKSPWKSIRAPARGCRQVPESLRSPDACPFGFRPPECGFHACFGEIAGTVREGGRCPYAGQELSRMQRQAILAFQKTGDAIMKLLTSTILASAAIFAAPAIAQTSQQPMTRTESGAAQAGQPTTLQSMTGQAVYREGGQEFGRVSRAVRADNGQIFVVVTAGNRMVMVPAGQISFQNGRHMMRGNEEQVKAYPEYRDGMAGYRALAAGDSIALAGGAQGQQAADGSRIMVQQSAPSIQVQQASPQVSVQQAQPNVTVRQAQPEIIVRQPAPTVTVDIPQPEIIVRMPPPDVNVVQARPEVEVRQAQPQVQIVQPQQQPEVQVSRAEPQVTVQPAQPQVVVQQGQTQPQVRFEREEAQVRVNQAQGQPNVRVEQVEAGQQADATAARTGGRDAATTASLAAGAGQMRPFAAKDLMNREIYNLRGEQLGDIERVLIGQGDRAFVVIGHGGFLGLGEKQILLPLEQIRIQGNRLVMPGLNDDQIRAMPEFRMNAAQGYREADRAYSARVGVHAN
jgi:ribosomal 30S subunit maturation factor RimM